MVEPTVHGESPAVTFLIVQLTSARNCMEHFWAIVDIISVLRLGIIPIQKVV